MIDRKSIMESESQRIIFPNEFVLLRICGSSSYDKKEFCSLVPGAE